MKRSDSEYGRSKEFVDFNMKLRNEQILPLELEKPDNTCEQFSFEPSERVINAINNALKDDDDPEYLLLENTNPIDFIDKRKVTKSSGNERPKTTSM